MGTDPLALDPVECQWYSTRYADVNLRLQFPAEGLRQEGRRATKQPQGLPGGVQRQTRERQARPGRRTHRPRAHWPRGTISPGQPETLQTARLHRKAVIG